MLVRLCQAGHWERALKLCQAAPATPYCVALAAVLRELPGAAGPTEKPSVEARMQALFTETLSQQMRRISEPRWLPLLIALLLFGPAFWLWPLVQTLRALPPYIGLLLSGGLLLLGAAFVHKYMHRSAAAAGAALVPVLVAAHAAAARPRLPPPPPVHTPVDEPEAGPAKVILRIYRNDDFVEERSFDRPVIKIGNLASSHLGAGEPTLARVHAVIELASGQTAYVTDLASASGTYINGERRDRSLIHIGDELRFGELRAIVKYLATARWLN
jgi:hypothetical protein